MNAEYLAALIEAGGTVLAALIGAGGAVAIVLHHKVVIDLARSVEAYHALETERTRRLSLDEGKDVSDTNLRSCRGVLRKKSLGDARPERLLNANDALRIRARYFSFK